jgi:hypothetical protein
MVKPHDLFVHHFGSRTFVGNGIDAEKLLNQNAQRFADKWGLPADTGPPRRPPALYGSAVDEFRGRPYGETEILAAHQRGSTRI